MSTELPINLTDRAVKEVREILVRKGIPPEYALRIGIKGGGCGASFFIGFDKPKNTDDTYQFKGVQVLIDRRHLMYLLGIELDFEERRDEQGFVFVKN